MLAGAGPEGSARPEPPGVGPDGGRWTHSLIRSAPKIFATIGEGLPINEATSDRTMYAGALADQRPFRSASARTVSMGLA